MLLCTSLSKTDTPKIDDTRQSRLCHLDVCLKGSNMQILVDNPLTTVLFPHWTLSEILCGHTDRRNWSLDLVRDNAYDHLCLRAKFGLME